MIFIGALGHLVVLIVSVIVTTWQSYLEWGSFPRLNGGRPDPLRRACPRVHRRRLLRRLGLG